MRHAYFLFITLFGQPLFSQSIITDRPDQTESTSVISKGGFQLETGTSLSTVEDVRIVNLNNSLFRFGVSDKLEFRVVMDFNNVSTTNLNSEVRQGISDLELGFKYKLVSGPTEISYLGHTLLPTGTNFLSSDHFGYTQRILIAGDISNSLSYGLNVGYDYISPDEDFLTFTYALGFGLSERVGFFLEAFGDYDFEFDPDVNFDVGFTYLVNEDLQLDVSSGAGINNESNFVSLGFSWRVGNN